MRFHIEKRIPVCVFKKKYFNTKKYLMFFFAVHAVHFAVHATDFLNSVYQTNYTRLTHNAAHL